MLGRQKRSTRTTWIIRVDPSPVGNRFSEVTCPNKTRNLRQAGESRFSGATHRSIMTHI